MAIERARVYAELPATLSGRFNLATADASVSAHETGDFHSSALLCDAMRRDDRIESSLRTRVQGVLGLPRELIKTEDGDQRRAAHVVEKINDPWWRLADEGALAEALEWRIMLGVAFGQVVWRKKDAEGHYAGPVQKDPQGIVVMHPQFVRWDDSKQNFLIQTREGEATITHGDGRWVVFGGRGQRPWMRGAVRSLWMLWIARQYAWRDWNSRSEGAGKSVLAVDTIGTVEPGERNQLINGLQQVWRGIVAELPQQSPDYGYGIQLLESATGPEIFDRLIESTQTAIAIRLLGQNLTTEVKGGSFAAAQVHDRVRVDYLKGDANGLADDCKSGILEPWCGFRFGDRTLAPCPELDAEPPADEKAAADAASAFADVLVKVGTAGFEVMNLAEVSERYGLKLKKAPEPELDEDGLPIPGKPGQKPPAGKNGEDDEEEPEDDEDEDEDEDKTPVAASELELSDSDEGQAYADKLVRAGTRRGAKALRADVVDLLKIVRAAETPAELKAALAIAYADFDEAGLAAVLEKAILLAELAGRHSVLQEVLGGVAGRN